MPTRFEQTTISCNQSLKVLISEFADSLSINFESWDEVLQYLLDCAKEINSAN